MPPVNTYLRQATCQLHFLLASIIQRNNALLKCVHATTRLTLDKHVSFNVVIPTVACIDFSLDLCRIQYEDDCVEFTPFQPNVLTISTPALICLNTDDWSVFISHGMGEIMSICSTNAIIQVTYCVVTNPIPHKIHVSIAFRGVSIFTDGINIFQASFRNTGRLAYSILLPDLGLHSYFLLDVLPCGSAYAFIEHGNVFINEILGGVVVYKENNQNLQHTWQITKFEYCSTCRFAGARSMIGILKGAPRQLAEVSFENVTQRMFSYTHVYTFDICHATDCMVVSYTNRTDIHVAKLSTGETVYSIPANSNCTTVRISPFGQCIYVSNTMRGKCAKVYSSFSGEILASLSLTYEYPVHVLQFISDQELLIYNVENRKQSITNIATMDTSILLPCLTSRQWVWPILIKGPYAFLITDGKLCAYK
jgi:hypothetical protein